MKHTTSPKQKKSNAASLNKEEKLDFQNLMEKFNMKTRVWVFTALILLIWTCSKILILGPEKYQDQLDLLYKGLPYFSIAVIYLLLLRCIIEIDSIFNNKVTNGTYYFFALPISLYRSIILIPYKAFIEPFLKPFLIIIYILTFSFLVNAIPMFLYFGEITPEHTPLIGYLSLTIFTILVTTSTNKIHHHLSNGYLDIEFNKGESASEKANNLLLYSYGFTNNRKLYDVSMKFFNQEKIILLIYVVYFIMLLGSSILKLGLFIEDATIYTSAFEVFVSSFATYLAFERILNNKGLFTTSIKGKEEITA